MENNQEIIRLENVSKIVNKMKEKGFVIKR